MKASKNTVCRGKAQKIPTMRQMANCLRQDIKEKFGGDVGVVVIDGKSYSNFPKSYADARRH